MKKTYTKPVVIKMDASFAKITPYGKSVCYTSSGR